MRVESVSPGESDSIPAPRGARIAKATLVVTIVLGAQALWLLIPAGTLWMVSRVVDSTVSAFFIALVATPVALVAFSYLLGVANRRYLRLAGPGPRRGPLDAVLPPTIVLALVASLVWLVFFAGHLPYGQEQLIP
jgi:hypothetical protein